MEEFTPLPHPRRSFSSPVTGPAAAWKNQRQLGGQVLLFLARVAAVYCLALRRLRVGEWVYLEDGPTGLHPLVRRELSSQLLHILRLALLRNESKMARMALSGQPSEDPASPLPSGNQNAATISPMGCAQRF